MLIHAIRAENFMRFARLSLENLPGEGILGIEGPNETGKTTIGEAILFAFFGKTRIAVDAPLFGLIRWGADTMSVEVEFSIRSTAENDGADGAAREGAATESDVSFLLYRQVDRRGTNYVKVVRLPGREDVACGNIQVADFVARSIRFDAREFQQSFYHDQYEMRRVHSAQVSFFESATGVKHLQEASRNVRSEIEPLEREFAYYQKEVARNGAQIEKYDRNVAKLSELSSHLAKTVDAQETLRRRTADLNSRAERIRSESAVLEERSTRIDQLVDTEIDDLSRSVKELRAEEAGAGKGRAGMLDRSDALREEMAAADAALERLETLGDALSALRGQITEEHNQLSGRQVESVAKSGSLEEQQLQETRRLRRRWVFAVPSLLALGALAAWLADYFIGKRGSGQWVDFASAYGIPEGLPAWIRSGMLVWVVAAAFVIFLVLVFQAWLLLRSMSRRSDLLGWREELLEHSGSLGKETAQLATLLELRAVRDIPRLVKDAEAFENERVKTAAAALRESLGNLLDAERIGALKSAIVASYQTLRRLLTNELKKVEKKLQDAESTRRKLQGDKSRTESEVRECQSLAAKKEALQEKNRGLEASADGIRGEVDLRLEAAGLLEETASSIRVKVGPTLTSFVKAVLPRLTGGRYQDVRVESDLEIKVYSREKNDFMTLDELSGGTNEALTLAMRLAVSQTLVAARTRQGQFVFLDEPFKMMDAERSVKTLGILRDLSPDLRQVLVVQPEFSAAEREAFDFVIATSKEGERLEVAFP